MIDIIHWSDYSSQPYVRVACTQEEHYTFVESIGPYVHSCDGGYYTFETSRVTCPECMMMPTFRESRRKARAFEQMLDDLGMTEEEYIADAKEKMRKAR